MNDAENRVVFDKRARCGQTGAVGSVALTFRLRTRDEKTMAGLWGAVHTLATVFVSIGDSKSYCDWLLEDR